MNSLLHHQNHHWGPYYSTSTFITSFNFHSFSSSCFLSFLFSFPSLYFIMDDKRQHAFIQLLWNWSHLIWWPVWLWLLIHPFGRASLCLWFWAFLTFCLRANVIHGVRLEDHFSTLFICTLFPNGPFANCFASITNWYKIMRFSITIIVNQIWTMSHVLQIWFNYY